jgi:hypothetical protein
MFVESSILILEIAEPVVGVAEYEWLVKTDFQSRLSGSELIFAGYAFLEVSHL